MSKRKHISLPLKVKLDALLRMDKGVSLENISHELGVSAVTVGDWRRNRLKLESWHAEKCLSKASTSRSRMKKSEYENTSQALFTWYSTERQKGMPISGLMLQEKAQYFRRQLQEGDPYFIASTGWLDKWKKRYGIRQLRSTKSRNVENVILQDENTDDPAVIDLMKKIPDKKRFNKEESNIDERNEWLANDNTKELSNQKISDMINNQDESADQEDNEVSVSKISHTEGLYRLEKAIEYVEQQDEVLPADILLFKIWSLRAVTKIGSMQKQIKIDELLRKQ